MPWCPKCKNEYREGITVCADCGCALVEELRPETPLIFGEEEQMQALKDFLEFNHLQDVRIAYDEQEQVYELLVQEEDKPRASRIAGLFLEQESKKRQAEESEGRNKQAEEPEGRNQRAEEPDSEQEPGEVRRPAYLYQNSAEKAEDNRSSAWALLAVGGGGLVVMALGMAGILPFHLTGNSKYMVYGIMTALFLLFLVMGTVSLKNSRIFARRAESENSLRESLEAWCRDNLTAEEIDGGLGLTEGEEVLYFKRVSEMKERLNRQFVNLDQSFLDNFIDDIYDTVFHQNS